MINTLVMGWNRAVPGREADAMQLFEHALGFWGKHQSQGQISSCEPIIMGAHGGDMNGFMLIKGDTDKLNQIQSSDEYMELVMRCGLILDGFGVIPAYSGDTMMKLMAKWGQLIK